MPYSRAENVDGLRIIRAQDVAPRRCVDFLIARNSLMLAQSPIFFIHFLQNNRTAVTNALQGRRISTHMGTLRDVERGTRTRALIMGTWDNIIVCEKSCDIEDFYCSSSFFSRTAAHFRGDSLSTIFLRSAGAR